MEGMPRVRGECGFWWGLLAAIVAFGLLSRVTRTGSRIFDKYMGDALYAAMVYVLLRLTGRITHVLVWSAFAMLALELFQFTGVPAAMFSSDDVILRVGGRLLGTEFGGFDLLAYAVGLGCIVALDRARDVRSSKA
jgi:hypothetical protein